MQGVEGVLRPHAHRSSGSRHRQRPAATPDGRSAMSLSDLLPEELRGLPAPWRQTHDFQRAQAAEQLPIEAATVDVGLDVLRRVLHALTLLSRPETLPLPEAVQDAYGFVMLGISKRVAVMDELTPQPFEGWLESALSRPPHALE